MFTGDGLDLQDQNVKLMIIWLLSVSLTYLVTYLLTYFVSQLASSILEVEKEWNLSKRSCDPHAVCILDDICLLCIS
jgi:uncharacterized membrane protein